MSVATAQPVAKKPTTVNLREYARGRDCLIRIPGVCCFDPARTVLAHYRLYTGGGQKPHDAQGAHACSCCHDAVDGRLNTPQTRIFTREQLRLFHAEGVFRTQELLRREGVPLD
jgi:hypothetical protein